MANWIDSNQDNEASSADISSSWQLWCIVVVEPSAVSYDHPDNWESHSFSLFQWSKAIASACARSCRTSKEPTKYIIVVERRDIFRYRFYESLVKQCVVNEDRVQSRRGNVWMLQSIHGFCTQKAIVRPLYDKTLFLWVRWRRNKGPQYSGIPPWLECELGRKLDQSRNYHKPSIPEQWRTLGNVQLWWTLGFACIQSLASCNDLRIGKNLLASFLAL